MILKYHRPNKKYLSFKELSNKSLFIPLTENNKKLVPDVNTRWLIFNIPAVITCPYKTGLCSKSCYALKAEAIYPAVYPNRYNNFLLSQNDNFVERMIYTIEAHLTRAIMDNKTIYFRIHESGDFYNQKYFNAWMDVIKHFEHVRGLYFVAYTKSFPYVESYINDHGALPGNFSLMLSLWADTMPAAIEAYKRLDLPIYTADTSENINALIKSDSKKYFKCKCTDCAKCRACFHAKYKTILCEIH